MMIACVYHTRTCFATGYRPSKEETENIWKSLTPHLAAVIDIVSSVETLGRERMVQRLCQSSAARGLTSQ